MRARLLVASAPVCAVLALLVAACGTSSPQPPAPKAAAAPLVGEQDPILSTKPSPKPDPVSTDHGSTRGRPPQFGTDNDEVSTSGARPADPCALVTKAEAQAIIGPLSGRKVAPLGPSCVYTPRRAKKAAVTVSVQSAAVSAAAKSSRRTIRLKLRGRSAYCVNGAQLAVLVPLAQGRVLTVAAPCPIAARFAAAALPRISS